MLPEELTKNRFEMLKCLQGACNSCALCELGRRPAQKDGQPPLDPHVFSSMTMSKFVVLGQNPGYNELVEGTPFVGAAGKNFDKALATNDVSRQLFYITNMCKCFTKDNAKPSSKSVETCAAILKLELAILRPLLIITLGAVPFEYVCPGVKYSDGLGTITKSEFGNVFAIYHPSPRNLSNSERNSAYLHQVALLCKLIRRL